MNYVLFTEQLLNGIQFGMVLFLLAAGLTLIFGIMDLVNLAHGSLYMFGAFVVASATEMTGSFVLALAISVPLMVLVGIVLEVVALRTLYRRDHLDQVLATFGLILFFRELVRIFWGSAGRTVPLPAYLNGAVSLPLGIDYPVYRLLIIALGLAVALGLYLLVQRTRIGMLIRAGASNREMAGALGVNIPLLFTLIFGIGAGLAGFSGMVIAPLTAANVGMGDTVLIPALVVIVIGGIGSIRGAFVAALLIGLIDTLGRSFLDDLLALVMSTNAAEAAGRALSSMLIYILMAAILFFRPQGLFPPKRGPGMKAVGTLPGIVGALVLALCAAMPFLAPALGEPFLIGLFARAMIWAIAALSLNLIMGYGGMVSFGHAAYLGVAAYTVGIFAFHGVTSAWIQWPAALAISAFVAVIFGAISLRTRGVYFIMITLALSQMLYYLARSAELYGSDDGLTVSKRSDFGLPFLNLNDRVTLYFTIFACLLLCLFALWRIVGSRFGTVLRGIKSNETRMEGIGIAAYRYKLVAFAIAGTMCGLAGILQANMEKFVSPDTLDWARSGEMIFMVVLGGMGSLMGPVIGAVVYWLLQDVLSDLTEHWQIIFGPFLILVVLFARGGIDGLLHGRRRDV